MLDNIINYINQNPSVEEVKNFISDHQKELSVEIKDIVNSIKDGKNKADVLNEIKDICKSTYFTETVIEKIQQSLAPFEETQFLRDLNSDTFDETMIYMFDNMILHSELIETIQQNTGLDEKHTVVTLKLLNTILDFIIVKRYTFNHFQESLYNLFRFNEQQIKFLWDLFIKNSEELQTAILLSVFSMCQSTRAEVQNLIEFFKNIFNEDDEEDDEKEMESGIC